MPRSADPVWNAFWRIDPRPDGSPAPPGPVIRAAEEKVELVAGGQAVAIIPGSVPSACNPISPPFPWKGSSPARSLPGQCLPGRPFPGQCSPWRMRSWEMG
jgi:hypothetical protein